MTTFPYRTHALRRLLLLVILISLCGNSYAQKRKRRHNKQATTLSVRDIASNYNINPAFLSDTLNFVATLDSIDDNDNLMMASYCNEIGRRVHDMKLSLKNDYRVEGNNIWIDNRTVVNDYLFYEGKLDNLAAAAAARSQHYLLREQRQVRERELQQQREAELAKMQLEAEKKSAVNQTKQRIDHQHGDIAMSCDSRTIQFKSRAREYKSLYYAYLAVYNHYNLAQEDYSDDYLHHLTELSDLQRHMLDSVLCEDNYTSRIDRFPDMLRDSTGIEYTDIMRAYHKYFVHTAVSISFNTAEEYYQYVRDLDNIHHVQMCYIEVVRLRKIIDHLNQYITSHYERKYAHPVRSYRNLYDRYNFTPTFNNEADAHAFLDKLNDFIAMQRIYLRSFDRLDTIALRADTIYNNSRGHLSDIRSAYKELAHPENMAPSFYQSSAAKDYENYLTNFEQVQQHYLQTIAYRNDIYRFDEQIMDANNMERVLKNYYRSVRKHTNLTPDFTTDENGLLFLQKLEQYITFQKECIADIALCDTLIRDEVEIKAYSKTHPNIYAVYKQVYKSYQMEQIASEEEFSRYRENLESIQNLQHTITQILRSKDANEINIRMKSIRDMGQMKQILKLD